MTFCPTAYSPLGPYQLTKNCPKIVGVFFDTIYYLYLARMQTATPRALLNLTTHLKVKKNGRNKLPDFYILCQSYNCGHGLTALQISLHLDLPTVRWLKVELNIISVKNMNLLNYIKYIHTWTFSTNINCYLVSKEFSPAKLSVTQYYRIRFTKSSSMRILMCKILLSGYYSTCHFIQGRLGRAKRTYFINASFYTFFLNLVYDIRDRNMLSKNNYKKN